MVVFILDFLCGAVYGKWKQNGQYFVRSGQYTYFSNYTDDH